MTFQQFEKHEKISPNNLNHEEKQGQEKLALLESTKEKNHSPLYYIIIMEGRKKENFGKECGAHSIRTETLKHCSPERRLAPPHLFNLIL